MPPRLVVHVGAPKMGSSSLQTALTAAPSTPHYRYVVWKRDGSFQPVTKRDADELFGYDVSGFQVPELARWSSAEVERARATLLKLAEDRQVVLSSESWGGQWGALDRSDDLLARTRQLFGTSELECEAVLYVRPQAPWAESGYLQFGMWQGAEPDAYAHRLIDHRIGDWEWQARSLEEAGFSSVRVRYVNDVVADFLTHVTGNDDMAAQAASAVHANPRLSLDTLLLMLQIPQLRLEPGLPNVELFIERHAAGWGLKTRPVPPLFGDDLTRRIDEAHVESNAALARRLPTEQAQAFARRQQQFADERAGQATISRTELEAMPINPEFRDALLTALIDTSMRARYGCGVPPKLGPDSWVDRPMLRGRLTSDLRWMNSGWVGRARTSPIGEWLVPRGSQRSRWAETVASLVLR